MCICGLQISVIFSVSLKWLSVAALNQCHVYLALKSHRNDCLKRTDGGESVEPVSRQQLLLLKWLSSPHLSQAFIYLIQLGPQAYNLPDMYISSCCFLFDLLSDRQRKGGGVYYIIVFAAIHPNEDFWLWAATAPDFSVCSGGNISGCRLQISQRRGGCEQHLKHIHMPWRDSSPQLARGWRLDVRQPWLIYSRGAVEGKKPELLRYNNSAG